MINYLRRYFITGLLVLLPSIISLYILYLLFIFADNILGRFINRYFERTLGFYIPGLGLILCILIILIAGFLSTHFFKRRLQIVDKIFNKFPLLGYIYPLLKQTIELILSQEHRAFKEVVLVEFPAKGMWSLGFVTNESCEGLRKVTGRPDLLNIVVPLAPSPTSGFIVLASHKDVIFLDISIKEAVKLVVTGGVLNPEFGQGKDSGKAVP